MPVTGALLPHRFGYTGPASSPVVGPPPHQYYGTRLAVFEFETDSESAAALVPEGLDLAHEPAHARVMFADFPSSTLGTYREAMLLISCTWQGRRVLYVPYLVVTGEVGLIAGREIWGAPKLFGDVGWKDDESVQSPRELTCWVGSSNAASPTMTGTMRPRHPVSAGSSSAPPFVFLKLIPSPEADAPPEVCELVEVDLHSTVHVSHDGRPELYTGPGTLRSTSSSSEDPWSSLPIHRLVRCTYGRFDSVLGHGRVIHRYQ